MTPRVLQQAALVLAAAREVGDGPVEQMKAIAICLKNRVDAGWYEDIIAAIEDMDRHAAHEPGSYQLDGANRNLQRFAHDIEGVFYQGTMESAGAELQGLEEAKFWCFMQRPIRDEFTKKIIRNQENHPNHASVGPIMFYD